MNDKQSTRPEPRPNGAPATEEKLLPPPQNVLVFSDRERAFFLRHIQQMNVLQTAVQTAIALVIEQHSLEGEWRLRPDGSALERVIQLPPAS